MPSAIMKPRHLLILTGILAALLGQPATAQTPAYWNQYRGPHGDGTTEMSSLPSEWSESDHIRWKLPIDGKAWSSPVVWGNQVWVTNATPDGKTLSAICVDLKSGEVIFDEVIFEIEEPQFCIERNSYASSTPVIEEGRIYLHYGAHGTACIDTSTFKTLWTRQDLECDHFRGPGSSPILWNDLLILTFDGADVQYITALNKATGASVWRTDRGFNYGTDNGDAMKAYSTPQIAKVADRLELVSPSAGATASYDPATGKEYWRVSSGGMNAATRPVIQDGLAYLGTADGGFKFFAVKLGGSGDVTDSHVAWQVAKGAPRYSSPIWVDGKIYVGNEKGILTCLDAQTGKGIWQERVGGLFMPSPLFADGKIYFFAEEGDCFVLEPGDEFKLLSHNKIDGEIMASPAIADGCILLRTKTALYCIE
jgi:outer membrane protein assembly factor BamB